MVPEHARPTRNGEAPVPLGEYDLEGIRQAVMSLIGFPGPGSPGVS
ncbi:hypothetical protein [Streptomyces sp. NPDC002763]